MKKYTIENFCECIPYEQIELVMGRREYKKFLNWMEGQTSAIGGVFKWDLEMFLKGLPVVD